MIGHAIKQISCGSNHTLALSIENNIFAWGYGDNGSLGQGVEEDSLFPIQLREKELKKSQGYQILKVEAGGQHSCAIIMDEPSSKKRKSLFD